MIKKLLKLCQIFLGIIGYRYGRDIEPYPNPTLYIFPNEKEAQAFSDKHFKPPTK